MTRTSPETFEVIVLASTVLMVEMHPDDAYVPVRLVHNSGLGRVLCTLFVSVAA